MTIPDVDMATVDLLAGCSNFSAEAYIARTLCHRDGRPFTDEEHERVGAATRAEIDLLAAIAEQRAVECGNHAADLGEMRDLMKPYAERAGQPVTVGYIRSQMATAERRRLDLLIARCESRIDQGLVPA